MYDAGYANLVCGDTSQVVISRMREACVAAGRQIRWDVMDATQMPYDAATFDVVIDKSLIDCLHCCQEPVQTIRSYFDEVYRVLVPGGRFLTVSFHSKHVMQAC